MLQDRFLVQCLNKALISLLSFFPPLPYSPCCTEYCLPHPLSCAKCILELAEQLSKMLEFTKVNGRMLSYSPSFSCMFNSKRILWKPAGCLTEYFKTEKKRKKLQINLESCKWNIGHAFKNSYFNLTNVKCISVEQCFSALATLRCVGFNFWKSGNWSPHNIKVLSLRHTCLEGGCYILSYLDPSSM